ncbi:efflux RND transporter permease subunit [Novosphingobium sp. M1R2S20]|uniref:Efflux RND transporter permease subunit n=1 Tax=Novosphingobium rhizovicinum TaxID=3228928 RepID=A0ABV3REI4_9SPHN
MTQSDESETQERQERGESEAVAEASSLKRFFFLKTTFGILLVLLLSVGGVLAYTQLVKESLPDLEIPQATITTEWPGADPQTIEQQVTQEIEDELTSLAGVETINSASFDSYSIISVEFQADANAQDALQRLRAAVDRAQAELPQAAERPSVEQISVDDRPILTVALHGEADAAALSALAERVQDRLETVSGVNEVELGGAREQVVQILLNPERLLALGLSPTTVRDAVQRANLEQPFGEIQSDQIGAVVRLEGQFRTVEDLAMLPVARPGQGNNATPIRLADVATVQRALENETARAFYTSGDGRFVPTISVSIKKTPGADTIKVIDTVRSELEAMQKTSLWPDNIDFAVTQNEATQIWDSLTGVFNNGWQAMLAVFVILFLVLSWREGLIAGLAVPVTFSGALLVVLLLGYSLNELVIIGMVLALGLLVDVFILMMEGMHEEIYVNRKSFGQAALATIDNYAMPAFAGQLTTILALAPLMAIGGVSGKFIRVLPVTAIACLTLAFVVALLVCVPLSRYLLGRVADKGAEQRKLKADELTEKGSACLQDFNSRRVLSSRKHAWIWVGGALAMFAVSLIAISQTTLELYPKTDGERLGINIELPADTQLPQSQEVADAVGAILREKPYFDSIIKLVGRKSPFASGSVAASLQPSEAENFIGFSATFTDEGDRDDPSYVLADQLRQEIGDYLSANVAGASLLVVPETGQPTQGDPIEITISGTDMDTLRTISEDVQDLLERTEGAVDVRDNLGNVMAEIALRPRREAVNFYGLDPADLVAQTRFAFGNEPIANFATAGPEDDLEIRMGIAWPGRESGQSGGPKRPEELALVRAFTPQGESVAAMSLLEPIQDEAPISIAHRGGQRALTVLAKNQGRAVTQIAEAIRPKLEAMQKQWPAGYTFSIGGEAEETSETFGSAGIALVIALIMVFGVLVIVFDSFPQAFIILITMPLALIGTFIGFFAFGMSFSFFAMIGVISLIGIVANDGIVMVDTMNRRLAEGCDKLEAAARGSADRLRPILTTSVTTIVGLVPLAIGNPMYRPLCFVIIFGLVSATIMSLFVIPALFLLLTRKKGGEKAVLD